MQNFEVYKILILKFYTRTRGLRFLYRELRHTTLDFEINKTDFFL